MEGPANEVVGQLVDRRSVRRFEDRAVDQREVDLILEAAFQAPTAGDQQLYSIIDVRDQQEKDTLSVLCDNQPFIASAPLVLVFCADCEKWPVIYRQAGCQPREPGVGDLMLAVCDAVIAAQNAVTAAWSLGIGSCYIGDVMERCDDVRALLELPDHVFPAAMLVLGYPTEQQAARPKPPRAPMDAIVMRDRYRGHGAYGAESLVSRRVEASGSSFDDWVRSFHARKYDSAFAREMTRSVGEYLSAYDTTGVDE